MKVGSQADALLVFILPRAFPTGVHRAAVATRSAHTLRTDRLSCESLPVPRHSVFADSMVAFSLSRVPTLSRFFPWDDPPLRNRCSAGLLIPLGGLRIVTDPTAFLYAPRRSLPGLNGPIL